MLHAGAIKLGVLAATLAMSGSASADPAFETFRDLCVKTRAEATAALAAADSKGWTDMPVMFQDEITRQGYSGGEGRAFTHNRILMLMYAGHGAPVIEGEPLPVRACAVAVRPANNQAVRAAAAEFAAVPADPALPAEKGDAYAFTVEGGAHRQVTAAELHSPRGKDLIRQGRVTMLIVAGRPAAPLLVYAIPTL